MAFAELGLGLSWEGAGIEETGIVVGVEGRDRDPTACLKGNTVVRIDPGYFRPGEVETLLRNMSMKMRHRFREIKLCFFARFRFGFVDPYCVY